MIKLILVRHGETKTNVEGKIHKYTDSEKLTLNGIKQIVKTSKALRKYKPSMVCCSKEN